MLLHFQTNFRAFTAAGNMKIGEVDPGSHFGKTLNCSSEAEESISCTRMSKWLHSPWDVGDVWVPFLSCQTRVHSQPCGTEWNLNLCFKKSSQLTNNGEFRKSCKCPSSVQAWHLHDMSSISCCSSFHVAQQREAIPQSPFWYVSFSNHSSHKILPVLSEYWAVPVFANRSVNLGSETHKSGNWRGNEFYLLLLKELLWASV